LETDVLNFLIIWVTLGVTFDLIFLHACHMMRTGKTGKALQANYHRAQAPLSEPAAVIAAAALGMLFPPYMILATARLGLRVKQERDRLREHGRG
jgi:hypothetical protein